jgi:hypothetical protein
MSDERVVPLHPAPEVSPEERARRLQVEVERLSGLPTVEWMFYLHSTAEKHSVDKVTLKHMVERVIRENEKKQREERVERRRGEERKEREWERKAEKKQQFDRRAKKDAEKEAGKKDRERQRELAAIAKLPKVEHAVKLVLLARRLGEDLEALRAELELLLADAAAAVAREATEPWPEPVDTRVLLEESLAQLQRYVVIHDDASATIYTLTVPFAWVHDETATYSPILAVQGADSDVAKTLLCCVHGLLTPRSLMIVKPTGPALFRLIDHKHPTLYIDNGDKLLAEDGDLADVVNASWTRGVRIPRVVDKVIYEFDPFCLKIINGIDLLPHLDPATRTRCIRDVAETAGRAGHSFQACCQ